MHALRRKLHALSALLLPATLVAGVAAPATKEEPPLSLREAVDRALRANLGLAVTRHEILKADDAIEIAKARFDTTFSYTTGFSRFQSAGADYVRRGDPGETWTNDVTLSRQFSTGTKVSIFSGLNPNLSSPLASPDISSQTGVEVRQPILRGAAEAVNLAPIARARLNLERSRVNLRITAIDLIRDIETAYRNLAAQRELVAIREGSLRSAESLLSEIRVRRRPGIGTATEQDELEAAAEVAARKVDIADAHARLGAAADTLRRLLGENLSATPDQPTPRVDPLPSEPPATPDFSDFLRRVDAFNPEVSLRDIDIRDANTVVTTALDADSPSLDLVAGARTLGRGGNFGDALSGQWDRNGSNLTLGLAFSVPLGMRETEANLRIARRSREQALFRMNETRRLVGYSVRSAWRDLVSARERLSVARTGVEIQTRAYAGARARNARGLASVNDVLQAATRLDNAKISRLNAMLDLALADTRRARLDGSILTRNALRWEELDDRSASDALNPEPADTRAPR